MRFFSTLNLENKNHTKFLLVGNPNTGKTTLFNSLTKSNEHVGNWHGVTVSEKEKVFSIEDNHAIITDLPGLYSLTTLSYEEEVASEYIFKNLNCPIINICDINNLKRNLFLTLQLAEITDKLILFINTFKNSEKIKDEIINCEKILNKLGINYFIGNANNKKEINQFKKILNNKFIKRNNLNKFKPNYLNIENIKFIKSIIFENCYKINYDPDAVTIRLLENDDNIKGKLNLDNQKKEILNKTIKKDNFIELNKKRFEYIDDLFKNINKINKKAYGSSKFDKILLNKYLALPIFFWYFIFNFLFNIFFSGSDFIKFFERFHSKCCGWTNYDLASWSL